MCLELSKMGGDTWQQEQSSAVSRSAQENRGILTASSRGEGEGREVMNCDINWARIDRKTEGEHLKKLCGKSSGPYVDKKTRVISP